MSALPRALLLLLLAAGTAHAHKSSDSYLTLRVAGGRIEGQWDIALRDLEIAVGLDANGDGEISWGELRSRHDAVATYALQRLAVRAENADCPLREGDQLVDDHTDGAYAVLRFTAECPVPLTRIEVDYRLLFDLDPQHRGLLRLEYAGLARTAIFGPESARQTFVLGQASRWAQFLDYCREGVWHIWIGIDHILFLVSLLLPAVLHRTRRSWRPLDAFKPAFWDVFRVVTSFTVAHSITLALATLGVVNLPSRLVESAIAASVVLAALNNLFPVVGEGRWRVAFFFGLVHGFGFASVLADLGLPRDALALALVAFNVGVELGQLAIVAVFLPVAFLIRSTWLYRRVVLVGGSTCVVLVASAWLIERAMNLKLLSP